LNQLPKNLEKTIEAHSLSEPAAKSLRLEVVAGPDAGLSVTVPLARAMIGRAERAELRLHDPSVSRFHAEVVATAGGVGVRDLESVNGVRYAGALLREGVVPSGARLGFGETEVLVDLAGELPQDEDTTPAFGQLRGKSAPMLRLFAVLRRLVKTELSVLLEGPTGSGKELAARALHDLGPRSAAPFRVLDCTAIPHSLAESILFGHEQGAFTGAQRRQGGIFESAEGGTVFLDEVGELPLDLQPKLLRVLSQREVLRLGASKEVPVDVRVVAATWRDLRALVNRGAFREDLYFRLAQARVEIPALESRREDIPLLVYHFLQSIPPSAQAARQIEREALDHLMERPYPGNVRELKAVVERAALMAEGPTLRLADLAFEHLLTGHQRAVAEDSLAEATVDEDAQAELVPYKEARRSLLDDFERDYLQRLMTRCKDNLARAADRAGVERHYLRKLLHKHGLRERKE
jgi:DNA-binding NtrC family response regulator